VPLGTLPKGSVPPRGIEAITQQRLAEIALPIETAIDAETPSIRELNREIKERESVATNLSVSWAEHAPPMVDRPLASFPTLALLGPGELRTDEPTVR